MSEKEIQAHDNVRWRNWSRAATMYDQILSSPPLSNNRAQKDRHIICLLGRCECLLELGKYEACLNDARKVLSMLIEQQTDCLASVSRTRRWLVHALCKLKKYNEVEKILTEWIAELQHHQGFGDICKTLERYKSVIQMLNGGNKMTQKINNARLEDEMTILDTKLDHWATNNLPLDKYSKPLSNKGIKKRENLTQNGSSNNITAVMQKNTDLLAALKVSDSSKSISDESAAGENSTTCSYCAITFGSRNELRQHCQTVAHQNVIMSDEGRDWKWRPPPRGFTLDSYSLCEAWCESQLCHYGNQCVEAHGQDELNEWKERFEYRRMRLQKACEKELYGKSYTEQVLEHWIQSTVPEKIMCEKVEGIEVQCEQDLVTSISSKTSKREWVFMLRTNNKSLKAVALLQDAHRNHFAIKSIKSGETFVELDVKTNQEWVSNKHSTSASATSSVSSLLNCSMDKEDTKQKAFENCDLSNAMQTLIEHQVIVEFHTEIYGTFRQAVCFDFGSEPLLVRHLCVDVVPVSDAEKIEEIRRDIINSSAARWDVSNTHLVKFETTIGSHMKTEGYLNDLKHEKEMLERYPCPRAQTFTLTQSTILDKRLTQNNYRSRIHELLYVEEIARYEQIARFNLRTKLGITSNYILTPAGMATSTAKYSLSGELFALMNLGKDVSEDTSAGRLILSNCSSVYISPVEEAIVVNSKDKKRHVFEAVIEDKGKNVIYLKLGTKCVEGMKLKADTEILVDIQFQLNRLPYCEWHHAVDKITDFKIIFPATEIEPNIPWTPKKQWSETCEPKLNAKQREAVNAITTSLSIKLPPILLIGPFGTGKTYTLAQAIKQLLTQPEAKILICTHSNSAADLYIKEYLHPWIEAGLEEATPLRVYYHKRWVATVNSVVQKYCITDGAGNFRRPTVEDIMKYRIVVVTLSISMELANLDIPKGYFTHIFLDEAAQAMECEAIMPLALANDSTRIVLAGDHMQMSPELFSAFAKERKLHISLLERLYDHYPSNFPCKILLCENYRAHEAIIKFTSELFYEQKLIASGKQPRHDKFYPLTFFTTRGEDVQDKNSTAFYNNAEVYEIVERVSELRKKWPSSWGKMNDASIGIMTPYADQVFRIRLELRKRRMGGISVERVLNVQGKQFRAVFLSTVRTRRTCLPSNVSGVSGAGYPSPSNNANEDADYGFLSNSKLLNTAITRAQSLVAVVGDPVALCSIGRCRKVWERFIEICDENKSLFGLTLWQLRSQLDGVELKRGYVLNPLAPEFVPRSLQPEAYLRDQTAMYLSLAANNHHPMGPLPGHHHGPGNMAGGPHPSLLTAGGPGQVPPHHAAQQMQNMYGPHTAAAAAYNAAAAAVMMNQGMVPGKGGGHHFHGHPNHMPMRPIGPPPSAGGPQQQSQPPPAMSGQQFNTRGPPPPAVHLGQPPAPGGANQFSQYMPWQHAQQQIRPPGSGGNFSAGVGQQLGLPTAQNPNASLWGPPPQTNPWSVLPKQSQLSQQPQTNANGTNGRQMPSQQTGQNMRGNSLPLQPPPPLANQPQQQQMRNNPNDLGFLANKALYAGKQHPGQGSAQVPPPPGHANFTNFGQGNLPPQPPPPNQMQMMNQRNMSGLPNGPISPMDPFMPRPPTAAGAPNQNAFFGQNNIPGQMKDKDFQFLNNVHVPLNIGGTMFQAQPPPPPPPNAMVGAANKQQSPTALRFPQPHEYASLLPPNVNIYEMAFEPKESQYKWYLKLLETQGQEAANKFTEVLRQVSAMMQQQQQPPPPPVNKPPQHMQQPYLNAGGNSAGGNTGQQQLMPRDAFLQPLMSYQQQQQQQQQAQQQRNINPYMGPTGTGNLLQPHLNISSVNDETPPLDINFNQQIDMVFNSIINGNEISQPILRDLFGVAGGSNNTSVMNGGDLLLNTNNTSSNSSIISGSKMFPTIGGNNGQPAGNITKIGAPPNMLGMSAPQQQPQTANPHGGGYMTNNALMNNKDYLMGTQVGGVNSSNSTSSSVPLYRRQGLAMGNGHQQQQLNSTGGNSAASTGGHSLASSTPDNLLTGNPNDIFAGLTAGSSTLIEALFQQDQQQQNNATLQKLLYNNFNAGGGVGGSVGSLKNDLDLFMSNNAFVTGLSDGINNAFHTQNFQQPTNNVQQHPANNSVVSTVDNRNTTYAAVLSQGPQQHEAAALQQQHQQQQQQQQHHKQNLNHSFQHNSMINNIGATGNGLGLGLSVGATTNNGESVEKDPFAAIRELGQGTNGFYNYFQ